MYIWTFKVLVETTSGYFVETTYDYECTEDEFNLLAMAKAANAELRYEVELTDIYEHVCREADYQEFRRYCHKKEYDWVKKFDEECEITVTL